MQVSSSQFLLVALAGAASGAINALAGGGSLVLFPALIACGLAPLAANVTNAVANWPGYVGGWLEFRADLKGENQPLSGLILVTATGSLMGCGLLIALPGRTFDLIVPLLVLLASLLLAAQPWIRSRFSAPQNATGGYFWIFLAALYGGYFGGALGVILLATLGVTFQAEFRRTNALKALLSLVNGTCCLIFFAGLAPVDWPKAAVAAPASLVGGYLGARLAQKVNAVLLRRAIVIYGLGVSGLLAWRAFYG